MSCLPGHAGIPPVSCALFPQLCLDLCSSHAHFGRSWVSATAFFRKEEHSQVTFDLCEHNLVWELQKRINYQAKQDGVFPFMVPLNHDASLGKSQLIHYLATAFSQKHRTFSVSFICIWRQWQGQRHGVRGSAISGALCPWPSSPFHQQVLVAIGGCAQMQKGLYPQSRALTPQIDKGQEQFTLLQNGHPFFLNEIMYAQYWDGVVLSSWSFHSYKRQWLRFMFPLNAPSHFPWCMFHRIVSEATCRPHIATQVVSKPKTMVRDKKQPTLATLYLLFLLFSPPHFSFSFFSFLLNFIEPRDVACNLKRDSEPLWDTLSGGRVMTQMMKSGLIFLK